MADSVIEPSRLDRSFGIGFIDEPVQDLEQGEIAAMGVITISSYIERFVADLSFWNRDQYERQWKNALDSILEDSDCGH